MSESRSRNTINLNTLICFNFYSGAREIEQLFRQVVGPDMTMQKSFILDFLYAAEKNMREVSEHLDLDSSAVSTLVDRMFKKGLITRDRDDTDRRVIFIGLTEEGRKLKDELADKVYLFNQLLSDGITDNEQDQLFDIVPRIKTNHLNLTSAGAAA